MKEEGSGRVGMCVGLAYIIYSEIMDYERVKRKDGVYESKGVRGTKGVGC